MRYDVPTHRLGNFIDATIEILPGVKERIVSVSDVDARSGSAHVVTDFRPRGIVLSDPNYTVFV